MARHLRFTETKTTILSMLIQRQRDFVLALDSDQIARAKPQRDGWRFLRRPYDLTNITPAEDSGERGVDDPEDNLSELRSPQRAGPKVANVVADI